jgi:hypothetical protein
VPDVPPAQVVADEVDRLPDPLELRRQPVPDGVDLRVAVDEDDRGHPIGAVGCRVASISPSVRRWETAWYSGERTISTNDRRLG